MECELLHDAAAQLGIQIIAIDRPGSGSSTHKGDRTLLDWPKDVLALADHFGIKTFGILGISGGGPYALACLKAIPREQLIAVTILSSMYPPSLGTSGMLTKARIMFWLSSWSPRLVEYLLD